MREKLIVDNIDSQFIINDLFFVFLKGGDDMTHNWKHKDAKMYAMKLTKVLGSPDEQTRSMMICTTKAKKADAIKVVVMDESVLHTFPMKHKDYCYSTRKLVVPPKFATLLAGVTGSIIIDGLKKEVTARCGMLVKNAVTLGFVEDVIKGKVKNNPVTAKKEYARRIMGNITPRWYKDVAGEKDSSE